MDPESWKRVGESSSPQRSVPKSRNRKSLAASSSPAPRRSAPKKKARRRREAESEKQFSLQDPGILDQKEVNGKVYYLLNWADDPVTKETYEPTWEPYENVSLDVVAEWQSRRSPVGGARAEVAAETQHSGIIDLTGEDEESIQDSQSPRPAKRRRITHGPNPTSEERTPEKKPRKVGTVESARFQSVSQESVYQKEKPNEIKDSYEDDQQLSAAEVGEARVEILGPQKGFDRDAYSKVITSSQPSQPSDKSQIPQNSPSQDFSSPQFPTPAPRHKYSSLIWDEDIEGVVPDSQELGSSSYVPSTTQVSKTASTSPGDSEVQTETDIEAAGCTQVTSGGEFSASGTIDSQSAEAVNALTQASYFDNSGQSSFVPTESSVLPSSDRNQSRKQELLENQARYSDLLGAAVISPNSSAQSEEERNSLPILRASSASGLVEGLTQAPQATQQSSAAPDEAESIHNSATHQGVEQSSLPVSSNSSPQLNEFTPKGRSQNKTPTPLQGIPSTPQNHDSDSLHHGSNERPNTDPLPSQSSQLILSDVQESSSVAFGTQVSFQRFAGEENHFSSSLISLRSSSIPSSSAASPSVPTVFTLLNERQSAGGREQPDSSIEQDTEQSQTLPPESYQPQGSSESSSAQTTVPTQTFFTAPATPVQTPREDLDYSSVERTSSEISDSPFQGPVTNTKQSPSTSDALHLQSASTEHRSQSLPSPPFEKTDSSGEQFAQLTSQNQPPTPIEYINGPGSTIEQSSPSHSSFENFGTMTFQQSQSSQPVLSNSTRDVPPASTSNPVKVDAPLLAKLKMKKAEAIARKAAERERAANASSSLPQLPAPLSPPLQSPDPPIITTHTQTLQPAAHSSEVQLPLLRSPPPLSPELELVPASTHEAAAALNHAAVRANQALPVQSTIEEAALVTEPIISPMVSPEAEAEPEAELLPTTLHVLPQDLEEYAVPLPMVSFARDVYVNTIRSRKNQRYEFLTSEVLDTSLVREIDAMIGELDLLCSHQDLIQDDFSTQRMDDYSIQAKWAENVSTKCIFLVEFLSSMQTEAKQIAVLVRPGRMLEIIEAIFNWHSFVYSRADRPGYTGNTSGGPMKISLIPTRGEILEFEPPSIVIAFDSTCTSVPFMKDLRTLPTSPTKLVPLLSLIVTNSIEHLERCFPSNLEAVERKIKLVSCLTQLKDNVGKLSIGYHDPPAAAKAITDYVMNGAIEGTWPLQPLPDIEDLKLDVDSSQSQQAQEASSEIPSSNISLVQTSQFGTKRQLAVGDDVGGESPKRQRLTPTSGEPEPTRISETVLHTSSRKDPSASAELSEIMAKTNALDNEQGAQVASLLKMVTELETHLRSREASESELRQINQDLEARCKDYESSIASIQPKYQEALNDRSEFEHENNLAKARQAHLRKELETKDSENTKLRDAKAALEKELIEARTALSSSSIPEIAELGKLKEEVLQERSEKERLQKRLTNMQGDLEYMRNNYQNSSTLAAQHASENQALQAELAKLREKNKRDMVRIHEIQKNSEVKEYLRRVNKLKEENSELEKELEKKHDELKAVMNGRRATRGTSVPRSPRMGTGGTMSPGPRPMGRAAMQMGNIGMAMSGSNGGSRGNSPAPGDLGGFRGTGSFMGEALFQDGRPPGNVRWGNHLQQ